MHKRGRAQLTWGGLLIPLGLLLFAESLDWLGDLNAPFWSLTLGAASLVFLTTFISDRRNWWPLVPGLVLLGIAVAVFLAEKNILADHIVATLILATVGLSFLLIYIIDRQRRWALIPALAMEGVAAALFLEGVGAITGPTAAGFDLGGISLGFFLLYILDREQSWSLIAGGALGLMVVFFVLTTAAKFILPWAIVLVGMLLLWRNLRKSSQRRHTPDQPKAHSSRITASARAESRHIHTAAEPSMAEGPPVLPSAPEMRRQLGGRFRRGFRLSTCKEIEK